LQKTHNILFGRLLPNTELLNNNDISRSAECKLQLKTQASVDSAGAVNELK